MDDYSSLFSGLSVSPGVVAILGAGLLIAAIYFASWLTNMVATFFDDEDDSDGGACCDFCGESGLAYDWMTDFDGMQMCGACARDDSRWSHKFLSGDEDDDDED